MQDAYGILGCYDDGIRAKKKKNYLQAARNFRMCRYYYEHGELDYYYSHIEKRALKSYYWFNYCKTKLTEEAQEMLDKEESEFRGSWRDFVRFNQQKIEDEKSLPSPNRPKKRKNYLKNFITYLISKTK